MPDKIRQIMFYVNVLIPDKGNKCCVQQVICSRRTLSTGLAGPTCYFATLKKHPYNFNY
ncbi:MAG: hypothetical protein IPG02_12670 [Ignavibacteria bacterium]|nr:hypothetical protein [Ignavibacteria bacterium]